MNENLKYIAKLTTIAISSFLKITILNVFSTILVVVIGFILLTKDVDAGSSGHVSALPFLILTFFTRPIGSVLFYLICISSPILLFTLKNKYILSKLANKVIADKSESFIIPFLDKILLKYQSHQPVVLKNTGDYSLNKLKIIQEIKNDKSENKWIRKIIIFGMKKISLDDVDFSHENQNFYDIIKSKTLQSLQNSTAPSRKPIWIIIGMQWLIVLFLWKTNY